MKSLITQIWMIVTTDCEQSARLTSESLDRRLNWAETAAVGLHRLICSRSRTLNRQMIDMHHAMEQSSPQSGQPLAPLKLSSESRSRIQSAMANAGPKLPHGGNPSQDGDSA